MRKLIILLILGVLLSGCSEKEVKEYTSDEFSAIYYDIMESPSEAMKSMTTEEINKNKEELLIKLQEDVMKKYDIKYDEKILIRGKLGERWSDKENLPVYNIVSLEGNKNTLPFWFGVSDNSLEDAEIGTVIVIEVIFTKETAGHVVSLMNSKVISK